jgi:hypothetical protein
MFSEINQMLRASVPIFVAWIAIPAKALARTVYDGDWGVLILTRGGACEPAVRCGVQITGGMVIYSGGMATVQGRVSRRGSVQVSVRSGNWWANGCGRLGGNRRRRLVGPRLGRPRHERRLPRYLGGATTRIGPGPGHLHYSGIEQDWMPDDATIVALRGDHVPILKTQ